MAGVSGERSVPAPDGPTLASPSSHTATPGDTVPMAWVLGNLTIDDVVFATGRTAMGLCGGNAAWAAIGARVWHGRVGLVTRAGFDFPRDHLTAMAAGGIQMQVRHVPGASIHNWSLYESATRRQFVTWMSSGTHADLSPTPDELPATVRAGSGCHVAPMPLAIQRSLLAELHARRVVPITLDPHEDHVRGNEAQFLALLPDIDTFLPSQVEAALLYGRDDPEAAARACGEAGAARVIVKLGPEGSIVFEREQPVVHVPAVPVADPVDPTGAGDAYCGGYLAARLAGRDALTAACYGTVSASLIVESRGAVAALDLRPEVARDRLARLLETVGSGRVAVSSQGGTSHANG